MRRLLKKPFIFLAVLLGLAILLFLAGPRVPTDETIEPVAIPENIEQYCQGLIRC